MEHEFIWRKLRPAIEELAHRLAMDYAISIEEGAATSTHNLGVPHFQVTMMSAQLVPEAIARITDVIADNGGEYRPHPPHCQVSGHGGHFRGTGRGARFHPPAPRGVGIYPVG